ncbi:MAG: glycosyltransferase family 39 protein [Candidatus Binatia bacterium]
MLLAAVLAGVLLRCEGLDRRPLWYDEAATLLHLSGRSERELRVWYDGRPLTRADVLGRPASVDAVVDAALADEPQSGAGYFLAAAVWQRIVGDTLPAVRRLSAVASTLAIGAAWFLARRLFGPTETASTVAALVALSPLHLRYAAEARPYALWSLALLVWVLATLRARERAGVFRWLVAGIALVAALAVHPLTLLVIPAVAALAGGRRFWTASGMAVSAWTIVSVGAWSQTTRMAETTAWVGEPTTIVAHVRAWLGIATSVFLRPGGEGGLIGSEVPTPIATGIWLLLGVAVTGVVALSLLFSAPTLPGGRGFVRRLAAVPWATLALMDLVMGGRRSAVARYLVPSWLGAELAVGGWIAAARPRRSVLIALLALATATAIHTRTVGFWWDTDGPRLRELARIAAAVNVVPRVVLVTDLAPTALVELVAQCDDAVELRLGVAAAATITAAEWERVRVAFPSAALLAAARAAAGPTRALAPIGEQGTLLAVADRGS